MSERQSPLGPLPRRRSTTTTLLQRIAEPTDESTLVVPKGNRLKLRRCRLRVTEGPIAGAEVSSDKERLRIGASPDCELVLSDDPTASRHHCGIEYTERGYLLIDLESTNGTFLDGKRIERAYLHPGAEIGAGQSRIVFTPVDEEVEVEPDPDDRLCGMIGRSVKMRQVFGMIRKIAPMNATVLIQGETGTGKELVARAIHELSPRAAGKLVVIDCGAIPPNLIEAELFGHQKGAFTGAVSSRAGAFERAQGGTVFLDELGELRLELQPKLLHVLENREVRRVGGDEVIPVDVRVVAATNRNLSKEVAAGRFREDLYFRLSAISLQLPPLRDRAEDVPHILRAALVDPSHGGIGENKRFTPAALEVLQAYGWPGNVRELMNVISHVLAFTDGDEIDVRHLPPRVLGQQSSTVAFNEHLAYKDAKDRLLEAFEREYVTQLLRRCGGNISQAARESGLHRKTIERLAKKLQLDARAMKADAEDD